jgi:O-antigen/teichoic acid export membrane protein
MRSPEVEQAVRQPAVAGPQPPEDLPSDPGTGTGKAIGLAAATMAANLVQVVFTVIFTRILGADGYGSLAALLNVTVILFVPGAALQVAAAREATLGRLGRGGELAGTLARWSRHILTVLAAIAVVSVLAREPLADVINIDQEWAAAAVPVTGALWLLLCLQRGLLQSGRAYREVGLSVLFEALGRLVLAIGLVALGLDVTGAYLGTLTSIAVTAAALAWLLHRRLGPPDRASRPHPLADIARNAALPIAALTLVAALQNVDVIMAKHVLDNAVAGVYAASTVAAKAVVWIAVGLGFWVLPEATRRAAAGRDPREVLLRALAVIAALSACALAIFAAVPELLLRTAFGADYESGSTVLFQLGAAYALLAVTYLCVQFLLGLHRRAFALVLALMALLEPLLLTGAGDLAAFARTVLLIHGTTAVLLLAISLTRRRTA